MTMRGVIQYRGSPDMKLKELRPAIKRANFRVIHRWHRQFMLIHFTERAKRRYKYQARSGEALPEFTVNPDTGRTVRSRKYHWIKKRRKGHTKPLVWSGDARRYARRQIKVTGTAKRATGTMKLPGYFYKYRKGPTTEGRPPIDKADELTRTILTEIRQLAKEHKKLVVGQLNRVRRRRTVRV